MFLDRLRGKPIGYSVLGIFVIEKNTILTVCTGKKKNIYFHSRQQYKQDNCVVSSIISSLHCATAEGYKVVQKVQQQYLLVKSRTPERDSAHSLPKNTYELNKNSTQVSRSVN